MGGDMNNKKELLYVYKMLLFIIILVIGVLILVFSFTQILENNNINTLKYTNSYETINVTVSKELIEKGNITVIDCRGGCKDCVWKNGHLPNAEWNNNYEFFYNTTENLLVYCQDGKKSKVFCENLVNHTYGKLYCLDGGFNTWKNQQ